MNYGPVEFYKPRETAFRGVWDMGLVKFKVYDLIAAGQTVTNEMVSIAKSFAHGEVLDRVNDMGGNNGLGFILIHPGTLGLTIAAHWWAEGSVLCQHIFRKEHKSAVPLDTIARPAVACVWELQIIMEEEKLWREYMMRADQDAQGYLDAQAIAHDLSAIGSTKQ